MAELHITLAQGGAQQYRITDRPVLIGREATCDIWLDDSAVSRRHAIIRPDGEEYTIEDLHSSNGTCLNGVRVTSSVLHDGDIITIHDARIRFANPGRGSSVTSMRLVDEDPAQDIISIGGPGRQPSIPLRRLELIYELSARLTSLRDARDLLEDAMDICFETFQFERGAIALGGADINEVQWPVIRNMRGADGELAISRTILRRVLEHGERTVLNDDESQAPVRSESIAQFGIRSAMCVPLMIEKCVLGAIYGDRVTVGSVYSSEDVDFLYGLARQVSIGLVNSKLMDEQKRKVRLENEIHVAREIQRFLFPAALPNNETLAAAAFNEPGEHISGDYYDVVELDDGRLAMLIADVTGKGVAASLLMANLQGTARATLGRMTDPAGALSFWNNLVCRTTDGYKFITCLLGILDPRKRELQLATAGHHPPYLVTLDPPACRPAEMEIGLPLGVDEDTGYRTTVIDLGPASCAIFLYTDGVTEAKNGAWNEFGKQRLEQTLSGSHSLDPQRLVREAQRAVRQFAGEEPQSDDITMLAVRI